MGSLLVQIHDHPLACQRSVLLLRNHWRKNTKCPNLDLSFLVHLMIVYQELKFALGKALRATLCLERDLKLKALNSDAQYCFFREISFIELTPPEFGVILDKNYDMENGFHGTTKVKFIPFNWFTKISASRAVKKMMWIFKWPYQITVGRIFAANL